MGNTFSSALKRDAVERRDSIKQEEARTMNDEASTSRDSYDNDSNDENETKNRIANREKEMSDFNKQLLAKREQRQEIIAKHRSDKDELKKSLQSEINSNAELKRENVLLREILNKNNIEIEVELIENEKDDAKLRNIVFEMKDELHQIKSNNIKLRRELSDSHMALQGAYSDIADLNSQNTESIKQILALKEVISVSKTLIGLREDQLVELKNKLNEIERTLADREASMLSTDLRQEYERQLQNIRTLRGLYEERARLAEITRQGLIRELDEQKVLYQIEVNKTNDLKSKVEALEMEKANLIEDLETKTTSLQSLGLETREIKAEMKAVNNLFSQVLLGYKTEKDLDTLVHRLKENHALLTQMAEKDIDDPEVSSALPKLLLEIVSQIDEKKIILNNEDESEKEKIKESTSAEEIAQNLPKVWKVLMELLSHQSIAAISNEEKVTTCYKPVETSSGTVLVPSVSQTYIRLKDLIVEKLSLVKEVNNMKQLNVHLESRLEEQERRLCLVTTELSKTWHVVSRLRRHHQQLHTHEKILKYELQQKRKLLNELKEELEFCREKWDQAREKNSQSEKDWKKLRAEFSSRKTKSTALSLNNSAESGYSDERQSDDSSESNDETEYLDQPVTRFKKNLDTVIDSSTDFHQAEREDPLSDMIDVADLPLDSNTCDEIPEPSFFCSIQKSNIENATETEDEAGEISNDSIIPDSINDNQISETSQYDNISKYQDSVSKKCSSDKTEQLSMSNVDDDCVEEKPSSSKTSNEICVFVKEITEIPCIDTNAILENIKRQNERLAKKDERLKNMENGYADVITGLSGNIAKGINMIDKLNVLHRNTDSPSTSSVATCDTSAIIPGSSQQSEIASDLSEDTTTEFGNCYDDAEISGSSDVDHTARFAARDQRLKRLEEQTRCLVNKVNKTATKRIKLNYKLEELHNIYGSERDSRSGTPMDDNDSTTEGNESGAEQDSQ